MGFVISAIVSAALLGVVVAVREGEFPGWGPMLAVVFATALASGVVGFFLPGFLWPVALVAGACAAALLIAWLCGTTLRRAAVTAGIWLGIRVVLGIVWSAVT